MLEQIWPQWPFPVIDDKLLHLFQKGHSVARSRKLFVEIPLTSLWFKNPFIISIPSSRGICGYNPTTSNDTSNASCGRSLISVIRVRKSRVSSTICGTFITSSFKWKSRKAEMFSVAVLLLEITCLPGTLLVLLWIFGSIDLAI